MSRVGKNPIAIPAGVEVQVKGSEVSAKGAKGQLHFTVSSQVAVQLAEGELRVTPRSQSKEARALWGTTRSLIDNMVTGVSQGFQKNLELVGVGYRAEAQGRTLKLQLAFSHDILFPVPDGIEIKTPRPTAIEIAGADKQKVGQVAAHIRAYRPPEPYKGKGIKYQGEQILRKEGKKK